MARRSDLLIRKTTDSAHPLACGYNQPMAYPHLMNKADAASIVEALREAACSVPSPVKDAFNLTLVVCYGIGLDRHSFGVSTKPPPEIYVKIDEK